MAILDLDNISFKKTIIGINCIKCGGNLKESEKARMIRRFITMFSLGVKKPRCYECENCKSKFIVA